MPYDDLDQLVQEHGALLHLYQEVQQRCTAQMQARLRQIEDLQALVIRLRAQIIIQVSTLTWTDEPAAAADQELLESSLRAADLVICQTGCVSDGAYWRVEDHCKRTGKPCVLVEQPDALRILRIRPDEDGQVVAAETSIGNTR